MVNGLIIGWVVGLLCGILSIAMVTMKAFDRIWDESYELGFKHWEELEKIRQANARKEEESFGDVKEAKET